MGSQAQDARHEERMRNARDKVFSLERQVKEKQSELKVLEEELAVAQVHLAQCEAIDAARD